MKIFEWDTKKDKSNQKKHGIPFSEATRVFFDKNAFTMFDKKHSEYEDRYATIGVIPNTKVLVVVHTVKEKGKGEIIRIISARKAIKAEAKEYFERI